MYRYVLTAEKKVVMSTIHVTNAFCRTPAPTSDEESKKRIFKRVKLNDPLAMYNLGCCYRDGLNGFTQDHVKALELWQQAVELGYAKAYTNVVVVLMNLDMV